MKSVQCPLCQENIYSETFRVGEKFLCPSCRNELTVEPYEEFPIVKTAHDFIERMAWAECLWSEGRLVLNRERLQGLGEFLVGALEMELWTQETDAQLEQRTAKLRDSLAQFGRKDHMTEIFSLNLTLLDMYRRLRERHQKS